MVLATMMSINVPMIYSPVITAIFAVVVLVAVVRGLIRLVSAFVIG